MRRSNPVEETKTKTSKYTQVCCNEPLMMTDNEKQAFGLYQNIGTGSLINEQQYTGTQRHVLQRALSDPHCPTDVNTSEELLLKSVYDNMYNQNELSEVPFTEMRRFSPEKKNRNVTEIYTPGQNIELVCNCDMRDAYFPRPKSRQKLYNSEQNIVYSTARYSSSQKLNEPRRAAPESRELHEAYGWKHDGRDSKRDLHDSRREAHDSRREMHEPRREIHDPSKHYQYSLDRKTTRGNKQIYTQVTPKPPHQHTYTCEQNSRILQRLERKSGGSLRRNQDVRNASSKYVTAQTYEQAHSYGRSSGYHSAMEDDGTAFIRRGDEYNSFRKSRQRSEPEPEMGSEFVTRGSSVGLGSGVPVTSGKPDRYSGASGTGGTGSGTATASGTATGSGTGNVRPASVASKRGNLTSDSELDDEPELMYDLSAGHLAECQCPCDRIGYTQGYHHLQEEHCFPPAPDVTRRLHHHHHQGGSQSQQPQLGTPTAAGTTVGKPEVTFYRSSSTPATCSNSSSSASGSSKIDLTSRHWWIILTVLLLAAAAGVGVPIALRISSGASLEERMEFASRLLQEVPLIDGHNDLPWNIRKFLHNRLKDFKFGDDLRNITPWSQSMWSHTDLPRLKAGHVSAQFWAAYVPCESQHRDAVQLTLEQIDVIRRFTDQYYPQLTLCTSAEEIRIAHQRHQLCSLIGVEGGHSLANSLAVLRTLYQVGVRYLTLTSTCNTPWADCSMVDIPGRKAEHNGLTSFGKSVVKEMNRLGMIVDLSHVSVGTMRDALAVSKAPVIFSHSSAHALCNSTRNVPDATLRKLALNRGIVMVNFYSQFLTCKDVATVSDAVAHINHIRDVAGVDNVGLGAGYDGINYVPKGLEDVSSYPSLFAELIGSGGWSTEDLKKLAGLNFLRVMGDVEKVRDEFKQAKVPPYEDQSPRVKNNNCSSSDLI